MQGDSPCTAGTAKRLLSPATRSRAGTERKSSSPAVTAGERRARRGDGSPTPAAQSLRGDAPSQNLPERQRRREREATATVARRSAGPHACTAFRARRGLGRRGKRALAPTPTQDVQCK
ncbi:hypothetical protein ERJ75_001495200 [Trypanosoma vivax]|nr:hypothetical protein ERJ75_001495200 [Trypanosoma vivax]